MKLTNAQIEEIHEFTKHCKVDWYDVQIELVDHLANGIENQWESNPNIPFRDALTNEFKKFGLSGFQDLIEQKTKSLNKYYRKEAWSSFKAFFKLPKIMIVLFSIWFIFSVINYVDNKNNLMMFIVFSILITHLFHVIRLKINIKKRERKTGKKWLFENIIIHLGGLVNFLNIGIWGQFLLNSKKEWSNILELIVSISIVLYILVFYISIKIIPDNIKLKASKEYPQYKYL